MPPKEGQCMLRNPLRTLIHPSAWEMDSPKIVFGILHELYYQTEVERLCLLLGIELDTTGSGAE